jgi:hypothetical protein
MTDANTRHLSPERPSGPPTPQGARAGGDGPRRRRPGVLAIVVLALACFALAAAALLRFYISDQIVRAPRNVHSISQLVGTNSRYFDTSIGQPRNGATVTLTATIRGDTEAATDDTAVWETATVLEDIPNGKTVSNNNRQLELGQFRLAFDRKTATLVNCCRSTATPAPGGPEMYGGSFFPFGMERRTYNVWDSETNRAWPMRFEGTDTVEGMEVYRYVQRVDPTNTGPAPATVPSTLLGLPGPQRLLPADRWYAGTVTTWIEPRSGVVVDRRQQITSSVRGRNGQGEFITAQLDLRLTAQDRQELVDQASGASTSILWLRTAGPLLALGLGLVLLVVAAALIARPRGGSRTLIET